MEGRDQYQRSSIPIPFSPDLGSEDWRLWQLIAAARADELRDTVEGMIAEVAIDPKGDERKLAFALALLADILRAGGKYWVRDSRLYVCWPDFNGEEGRGFAREALSAAREMRSLTADEVHSVRRMFAPDLDGEQLSIVLKEAEFQLQPVTAPHPTGHSYQEAFAASLRY